MKKLTSITPYSDDKLTWDEKSQKYQLALEYCNEEYDHTFADDSVLKHRIKKNTKVIYNYIDYHINSYNKRLVYILLHKTEEGRNFLFDLLSTQFDADTESGYNDIGLTPAINVASGQVIDRNEIRRNLVSVDTEQVFDNSHTYFGINIGYQGVFPEYYHLFFKG